MNSSRCFRISLALGALFAALFVTGCNTPQKSAGAPAAPNWYDSYYTRNGRLYVPEPPNTVPIADPMNY